MIKCDYGKTTVISGHPVVIIAEFENIARDVRKSVCSLLGEEAGMRLYNEAIKKSELSVAQRNALCEEAVLKAEAEHPEHAKRIKDFVDGLFGLMFEGTGSPGCVEEE